MHIQKRMAVFLVAFKTKYHSYAHCSGLVNSIWMWFIFRFICCIFDFVFFFILSLVGRVVSSRLGPFLYFVSRFGVYDACAFWGEAIKSNVWRVTTKLGAEREREREAGGGDEKSYPTVHGVYSCKCSAYAGQIAFKWMLFSGEMHLQLYISYAMPLVSLLPILLRCLLLFFSLVGWLSSVFGRVFFSSFTEVLSCIRDSMTGSLLIYSTSLPPIPAILVIA